MSSFDEGRSIFSLFIAENPMPEFWPEFCVSIKRRLRCPHAKAALRAGRRRSGDGHHQQGDALLCQAAVRDPARNREQVSLGERYRFLSLRFGGAPLSRAYLPRAFDLAAQLEAGCAFEHQDDVIARIMALELRSLGGALGEDAYAEWQLVRAYNVGGTRARLETSNEVFDRLGGANHVGGWRANRGWPHLARQHRN